MGSITVVSPTAEVQCLEVQGEIVLLNSKTGDTFGLDPVGTELWKLLVQSNSFEQWLDQAYELFDLDRAALREELVLFAERLSALHLVTMA